MPLEFVDIHIQPDRFAEIKFIADLIQSIENLVGSCIVTVITDGGQAKNVFVSSDFQYSGFRGESKGDRFYSMIL